LHDVHASPLTYTKPASVRDHVTRASRLASAVAALTAAYHGRSGVCLLPHGFDAFSTRVHSARLAQTSIDVQTYIWRDDATGRFIARELLLAADRGVRVRVLIDDMDARPRDLALAALDAHPNIDVRVFNPFRTRSGLLRTIAELSQRGKRLNHRMHNKSWIVDRAIAISGGRNLGNEYFASAESMNFIDLDVLMLGPAVEKTAREFDAYWNCSLAVSIAHLRKYSRRTIDPAKYRLRLEQHAREAMAAEYARMLDEQNGLTVLLDRRYVWSADVRVVADHPSKALGAGSIASHVLDSMVEEIRAASREVLLISPYFVPGMGGTAALRSLALQGANVEVLTNSLAATDVAVVHSGYAKYRRPLLEAGVRIYELKAAAVIDEHPSRFRVGSSRASLHTKAAVIDAERVFVGSFNIDPRSAELNCEMGVWVRSAALAQELALRFREGTHPLRAFELQVTPDGKLTWIDRDGDAMHVHHREPHASSWRRAISKILGALPIESLL